MSPREPEPARASEHALSESDQKRTRYVIGIDLGTTNSALCFCDTDDPQTSIHCFAVPQVVAEGQVESRETLPSFHFALTPDAQAAGLGKLPWRSSSDHIVGCLRAIRVERFPDG